MHETAQRLYHSLEDQYAVPEEVEGQWRFRVKENGPWKCDHMAINVVEVDI